MSESAQQVSQSNGLTPWGATTSSNNDRRQPRRLNGDSRKRIVKPWQPQNLSGSSNLADEEEEGTGENNSPQHSVDLGSENDWTFVGKDYCTNQGTVSVKLPSQTRNAADAADNRGHQPTSTEQTLCFDDPEMETIVSDSDLEWDKQPFDYAVPFERPILEERYSFETEHPRAAPIIRIAMGLSSTADTGRAVASHARSLQNRVVETYNDASNRAVQMGQQLAETAGRVGGVIADEVMRTGQEVTGMVDGLDGLPAALPAAACALGDGWRQGLGALMRNIATVNPPPEQNNEPERGRRW